MSAIFRQKCKWTTHKLIHVVSTISARMDSLQELQQCDGPYNEFFFITNDARAFNGIGVPGLVSRQVKVKRPIQFVEIYRIYRNRERSRQEAAKRDGGWRAHHELRGDRQIE